MSAVARDDARAITPHRTLRRVSPAVAVLAAITLAGCTATVSLDGSGEDATAAPAAPGSASAPAAGEQSPTQDAPAPSESAAENEPPSVGTAGEESPFRLRLRGLIERQLTCGGGELTVDEPTVAVEITDDCGTLTVSGTASYVVAQHVDSLIVTGDIAEVSVTTVQDVTLDGDALTVTWEEGSPVVEGDALTSAVLNAWLLETE